MILAAFTLIARPLGLVFGDRSLLRTVSGIAALTILCLTVAHGCHAGGHDLDLEP